MAQGFLLLRGVLVLFDVIELVSKACQVLSLDYSVHMIGAVSLLAISKVIRHLGNVIEEARVNLLDSRLILSALAVPADVLGSARDVVEILIVLDGSLGGVISNVNDFASCSDLGNGVRHESASSCSFGRIHFI